MTHRDKYDRDRYDRDRYEVYELFSLAENMLEYAKNDNLCIDPKTYTVFANHNCPKTDLLNNFIQDPKKLNQLIDAWSMRHFHPDKKSGHDHFFATFAKDLSRGFKRVINTSPTKKGFRHLRVIPDVLVETINKPHTCLIM